MLGLMVRVEGMKTRAVQVLRSERGAIDDLLMRGLFVVAVLGIAAAVIAYFSGLNNWIGDKLTAFMNSH